MKLQYLVLSLSLLLVGSCYKYDNPLDPENAIPQVATPSFNPLGGSYAAGQTVTISCSTSGAIIRYTTNGSDPTESSTQYSTPISVSSTITLKAKAYKDGWTPSSIAGATYTITIPQVATPSFNPPGGDYSAGQTVTISCSTSGAIIHYTTDGSDPTESSTQYSTPISVSSTITLKAKAYKDGLTPSSIAIATYTITIPQVATPSFNPSGGTYAAAQTVTISCSTSGAIIRYTTDGSDPTESSLQYSTPISVSSTITLKARAYKDGWTPSSITSAIYTITMMYVTGGTFNNGTSDVTISSFYIDIYELTQAGYQALMGMNPSYYTGVANGPVERVTWFNAIEYCNRRSMQEALTLCYSYSTYGTNPDNWPSGWNTIDTNHTNVSCNWTANGYRLPTEMEWMFAAKGGNQSQGYTYSGSNDINAVAWYSSNCGGTTHSVGTKAANELGTFDMSGNVWEWCWDIYGSYPSGPQTDPHGTTSGSNRVGRGGAFDLGAYGCTVSYRFNVFYPTLSSYDIGFRVCRVSP